MRVLAEDSAETKYDDSQAEAAAVMRLVGVGSPAKDGTAVAVVDVETGREVAGEGKVGRA